MDRIRTKKQIAINSRTEDSKHILIWDFDNIDLFDVLESLNKTQGFHGLGCIYIIKSNHGFNAFCLDKFFVKHAHNIKYYTRWSDFRHTESGYKKGLWCLRLGNDKKIIKTLMPTSNWSQRQQSNAHLEFFNKYFKGGIPIMGNFDSLKDIEIESYLQDVI